ncbi:hypothetical protein [Mesorhizobium sp. NZP2077]|uniref:hypothetical protein n=1 Tax=Mesorhizobium sp. NZP2077 TaxID=2483404 RepID=UPI001556D9AA|nr:hypothetical protein [Mesorhizobium sp. NZP2077]QKC82569.1 hypothetical protein EB232_13940 [Mesorhizobium sp. NZP2077]QKD16064.1 hypothetical protein HGP13_13740 [Mesorhizobium sp. NZP2077]
MTDINAKSCGKYHTRQKMLAGGNNNIDIEDYERELGFLRLPGMPQLSQYENKQRYIFAYYLRMMMIMSIVSLFVSFMVCIAIFFASDKYISSLYNSSAYFLKIWPWSESMQWQLGFAGRMPEPDQRKFVVACSTTSGTWLIWLSYVAFSGLFNGNRRSFFDGKRIFMFAVIAAIAWLCASQDLFNNPSIGPSLFDTLPQLLVKMTLIISFAYWSLGLFIFLFLAKIRSSTSKL